MDSYIGVFPRTHKELHIVHQILFRYWDILSLLGSVKTMYDTASLEYPKWINYILGKIGESYFNEFEEEFDKRKKYDEAALESRLNAITANLHSIIDEAFEPHEPHEAEGGSRKTRKWFFPKKYFAGLSERKKTQRKKEIKKLVNTMIE
jgi:hypothetical protein